MLNSNDVTHYIKMKENRFFYFIKIISNEKVLLSIILILILGYIYNFFFYNSNLEHILELLWKIIITLWIIWIFEANKIVEEKEDENKEELIRIEQKLDELLNFHKNKSSIF